MLRSWSRQIKRYFKSEDDSAINIDNPPLFVKSLHDRDQSPHHAGYDQFLSLVGHELRSPLSSILGYTDILLMQLAGPINEAQMAQLNIVKSSSYLLLAMINDIVDVIGIESGHIAPVYKSVNCLQVISKATIPLVALAKTKGLCLQITSLPKAIFINTDHKLLSLIITKLVRNAINFSDSGEIKIMVEKQLLDGSRFVVIHIEDMGIGIEREDQEKLFQAFQRFPVQGRLVEGAGLGLYLSEKIAGLMHASIQCVSDKGKGSRFSIVLPEMQV